MFRIGLRRELKVLTTHLGEAVRELNALTTHLNAVAAESRTLQHRLTPSLYMADPKQFLVADERGHPQLGFDDGSREGTDVYDGFEDIFRGTETLIRDRARVYVPLLKDHQPILDIGCGRGELLEALRDAGLTARVSTSMPA